MAESIATQIVDAICAHFFFYLLLSGLSDTQAIFLIAATNRPIGSMALFLSCNALKLIIADTTCLATRQLRHHCADLYVESLPISLYEKLLSSLFA
jgi:hypothetical protein